MTSASWTMTATALGLFSGPEVALGLFAYALFVLVPVVAIGWAIYYLLSLPLRRQERARFFLDLLDKTLQQGQPVEQTLVAMANSRDKELGMRFHLLAAHLEEGIRLGAALERVPRFLPPQICAMLRAGEALGDLRKVLPACRAILGDAQSRVRGAASYLVVISFVFTPFSMFMLAFQAVVVFPKFKEIVRGYAGTSTSVFDFVVGHLGWLIAAQGVLFTLLLFSAVLYIGGPRLVRWLQFKDFPLVDGITWRVPWKRKRMQRNFSAILAVLLDGGVPEPEALRLAGDCAANEIVRRRAARVELSLAHGQSLPEAVAALDEHGEFQWRLRNATHSRSGFLRALAGWHESLDARAFQEEQAAAHAVTSGLVLFNGMVVGLIALAVFGSLVAIIEAAVLW